MKTKFICHFCKKYFFRYPSERRGHKYVFCSRKCRSKFIIGKNNPNFKNAVKKYICKNCKIKFKGYPSVSKHWFCSISCRGKYLAKGSKNGMWKGGRRYDGKGYVVIYSPNHPFKHKDNGFFEHRLIMEKHIGRYLTKDEIVHHINEITNDNRIENLKIMTQSEHIKYHKTHKSST